MPSQPFSPVDSQISFPEIEKKIIDYWKKNKTFEKSLSIREKSPRWTFLDGPPFVTGLPHYGSLLSSIPKDVFGRYWSMKGYYVPRVWGWDGHGLPIENKVENELGLKRKKDIEEKVGVKEFINRCRKYVDTVSDEWEWYVDHIGRWVDFKNAYKTWGKDYMESVMWVFKQMYEKGYIYKGLRVSLYCPHCVTPISNFEVAMDADNYKEMLEAATIYKFRVKGETNTYFLAWSTTPWNKIVTTALAVNPKLTYVKVQIGEEQLILAKQTLPILKNDTYKIVETFKGLSLIGMSYEPLYDYFVIDKQKKAFIVSGGDFVTADEGTGIVTIAPYGEDDLNLMKAENIHIELHVDEEGMIKKEVPLFGGLYYLKSNEKVDEELKSRNLIYRIDTYSHTVPTCWRCHTRLYYAPQDAWYVDVQQLKPKMKKTNENINWIPDHFKYGRFLKSMEAAPDWCISRSRYWGSPVPVWECACGERFVPGSLAELEKRSGTKISDLHKPEIDGVTITCSKCQKTVHRVPEVLDSWIEAGSASFAERHFPFNQTEKLEDFYPPDFIAEYTGQIRAWFYVVHVIAAALYESIGFKNVLVTGVILGDDGRKMSKNFQNYPDPKMMLEKYGGDALRLYLLGSPVMMGNDILISEEEYRNQVKDTLLILWNSYKYFVLYANQHKWQAKKRTPSENILDKWILTRLDEVGRNMTRYLDSYDTPHTVHELNICIQDLSTWYIRRSRDRFATGEKNALATLHACLSILCRLSSPLAPFITEAMYRNLTGEESVHLVDYPTYGKSAHEQSNNAVILDTMKLVREIVSLGNSQRKDHHLSIRQPLSEVTIDGFEKLDNEYEQIIKDELNVKSISWKTSKTKSVELNTTITEELKAEGDARNFIRTIQNLRKKQRLHLTDKIIIHAPNWPETFVSEIKEKTLATAIRRADMLRIERAD
ncbi:isoleucine--tRNA ligase [Candidatus Roizmanbacteria bacterium]|nr:isoleucine--tRNA ligase [Candidatus Roizmanbacteria bacterium]